eukprot:2196937-Lingulodinium_polyedra.AAC.1
MPRDQLDGLLARGLSIRAVADFFRMRACAETGGWIIDGDTIWLRPVPNLCVRDPVSLGHFFGSLHAHPGRRGPQAHLRYWSL